MKPIVKLIPRNQKLKQVFRECQILQSPGQYVYTFTINICVCYLPPEESSRRVNPHGFYDTLITQIYQYQDNGNMNFICGDFNGRYGVEDDFIEGVDPVCERHVVDHKRNKFGDLLLDFLINVNYCMLNGRNHTSNDFTSVSTKGLAVVDYALTPYEYLPLCSNVRIRRAIELFRDADLLGYCNPQGVISDHYLVSWSLD